jgi:hypothetical protein
VTRTLPMLAPLVLGALAACASAPPEAPSPSAADAGAVADAGVTTDAGADPEVSVRGNRYCELLLVYFAGGAIDAQVWGTQGLNACPADLWTAIDADALRTELNATVVRKNGPRYWLIDAVTGELPDRAPRTFGGLEMRQLATIAIAPGAVMDAPYRERTINRNSRFTWRRGQEVYELTSADGVSYVMQSYAQLQDPNLSAEALPGLGARLALPTGWTYQARILTEDLVIDTPGQATVLQDELSNTYSRRTARP